MSVCEILNVGKVIHSGYEVQLGSGSGAYRFSNLGGSDLLFNLLSPSADMEICESSGTFDS